MQIRIREAAVADADELTRVQIASWRTTYRGIVCDAFLADLENIIAVEKWKQRLAEPERLVFVAEDAAAHDHGIIGFVTGGQLREAVQDYDGELYAIYLLLPAQRRGTGRALTIRLAEALHKQGLRNMLVWVLVDNPAVGFYHKMGAQHVTEKRIAIGSEEFMEAALGWRSLDDLIGTGR